MRKKCLAVGIVWALLMVSFYLPEKRFSQFENRYLETFETPKIKDIVSLKWMDDFEKALCEQLNFRNISITIKTYADKLLGQTDNGRVYFGSDGYLLEMENTDFTYLEENVTALNILGETSTPIDFMPVYNSLAMLSDIRPSLVISHQDELMEYFKDHLENINIIDLKPVLLDQKDYYYKTDHHWTMLGAKACYEYYMGKEIDAALDSVKSDFKGTLYAQAPTIDSSVDTILTIDTNVINAVYSDGSVRESYYSESHLKTHDAYRYYLDGNYERIDIHTSNSNGKSLLLIKDSYANCFVPFLDEDYEYITILDLRYGATNVLEVLNEGFEKCLVLYEMDTFCNEKTFSEGISHD